MKNFIVILAWFMLFKPILPLVEYVVFYDYIKNELCVNKDKPELKCNGKCHLMKEMAKASDNPESGQDKKHFSVETNIIFLDEAKEICIEHIFVSGLQPKINSAYNNLYLYTETISVFHPPVV
ncbi:hypothetical protein [Avrilella dinanensis]|nr:hypothetical protein [Avrilella dinanensis]